MTRVRIRRALNFHLISLLKRNSLEDRGNANLNRRTLLTHKRTILISVTLDRVTGRFNSLISVTNNSLFSIRLMATEPIRLFLSSQNPRSIRRLNRFKYKSSIARASLLNVIRKGISSRAVKERCKRLRVFTHRSLSHPLNGNLRLHYAVAQVSSRVTSFMERMPSRG